MWIIYLDFWICVKYTDILHKRNNVISSIIPVQWHEMRAAPKNVIIFLVWKSTPGMKMCVGGKQEKKREHQYFSTAAECTVSLWWKKSFLSVSSHRDVKDVSAMPARIQWREILTFFSITLWWVSAIYNRAWILCGIFHRKKLDSDMSGS